MTVTTRRTTPGGEARTYGNWRRPTSPGLLGLGTWSTAGLFAGLVLILVVVSVGGVVPALITALALAVVFAPLALRNADGKTLLARGANRAAWIITRREGSNIYRSGPLGRTGWGSFQLPGIASPTRLSEHTDSYARPFALIHTPATGSFAVVLGTEPDGAALVDVEQVDAWVAQWGHWLATLADEPGIEAASVTLETAPDSGRRLRREIETHLDADAPAFARQVLNEIQMTYPSGSSTVKAYVTLTFSATTRPGGKPRTGADVARELAARLPGLTGALQSTGAGAARTLSAQQLCETIRVAFDPAVATLIDDAHAEGEVPVMAWTDVGPTATQTSWDGFRHDSARSVTWAMTQAPRGHVQSSVLARLLAPHRDIARKRVTLLYRPIDASRAAAMVEADLRSAQFRATSTKKMAARDSLGVASAAATAAEEAAGAGLVNFGMLVTATVLDPAKEADARAAIDNLAATARLRLRPVFGAQDSAFVAALPLGLVLAKHLSVPAALRENL